MIYQGDSHNDIEILLVEDNADDVEMTLRALRKNPTANNILAVSDGVEALDFLYNRGKFKHNDGVNRPGIILLDLNLPGMDGKEVLRIIKSDPEKKVIPIIVLTSSRKEGDIVESYRLGVNSYIVKPMEFNEFADAIHQISRYWLRMNQQ